MSVYIPMREEGFELCHPEAEDDFESINLKLDGQPRFESWRPIRMRLIHRDEGQDLAYSDSPWLGSHALVFRRAAVRRLGALLDEYGELLSLACEEAELHIFNVTRLVDALDEQRSVLHRFSSGRIMQVERYVFRADAIEGVEIFKIPNLRVSDTFVSGRFVKLWKDAHFKGLKFQRVWTAE